MGRLASPRFRIYTYMITYFIFLLRITSNYQARQGPFAGSQSASMVKPLEKQGDIKPLRDRVTYNH